MFVLNLMLALFAVSADSSSVAGSEARHVAERFSIVPMFETQIKLE